LFAIVKNSHNIIICQRDKHLKVEVVTRIISHLKLINLRKEARANLRLQSKRICQVIHRKARQQLRNSIKYSLIKIKQLISNLKVQKLVNNKVRLQMIKCNKMMLLSALTLIKKMNRFLHNGHLSSQIRAKQTQTRNLRIKMILMVLQVMHEEKNLILMIIITKKIQGMRSVIVS